MAKKRKSGGVRWLVVQGAGDSLSVHYDGPDKSKARAKAEAVLSEDGKAVVEVLRVSRTAEISAATLQRVIPREAF